MMKLKRKDSKKALHGFSMIELTVVVAIFLILAAISIPNLMRAVRTAKLRGAGSNVAGLIQQARIRAVQDSRYYSIYMLVNGDLKEAFVDIYPQNVNGASGGGPTGIQPNDPVVQLSSEVSVQPKGSAPDTTSLQTLFLGSNPAGVTPWDGSDTSHPITFGPEGLPCTPKSITGGTVCNTRGGATAYWIFFQDNVTQNWEAVTITPAGRTQKWYYSASAWSSL
jgi:prepilin-type N-terminal cleavage/methylation domain-containing protein